MSRGGIGFTQKEDSSSTSTNKLQIPAGRISFQSASASSSSSSFAPSSRTTAAAAASSMTDDMDADELLSHSLDAEFEGGQWINGEFFYKSRRAPRTMSKDEHIYGFDDEVEREYSRAPPPSRPKKMAGGINFVKGDVLQPEVKAAQEREQKVKAEAEAKKAACATTTTAAEAKVEQKEESSSELSYQQLRDMKNKRNDRKRTRDDVEEDERRAAGRGGLGSASSSTSLPSAAASSSTTTKAAPAKVDKDFGSFNKHGTGFGLKMLQAFGFKPGDRLGKHGQGVVNPIIAKLRPKDMGLGFGNFKEVDKDNMARNAKEEAEIEARKEHEKRLKAEEKQKAAEEKLKSGWKKDGATGKASAAKEKPKRVYKTAAELLANDTQVVGAASSATQPMIIMDMRGATAKVTSLDQISTTAPETVSTAAPQMLPELQHNLRLLVSMTEEDLRVTDKEIKDSHKRLENLRHQKEHIETSVEYEEGHIRVLEAILKLIETTRTNLKSIQKSQPNSLVLRVEMVLELLRTIQSKYKNEYVLYEIPKRSLPMVFPLIKGLLYQWEPLQILQQKEEAKKIGKQLVPVLDLIAQFKPLFSVHQSASHHNHHASAAPHSLYYEVLSELFLPKIRLELSNNQTCSVRTHMSELIELLVSIEKVCPKEMYLYILKQLLFPKLKFEVTNWNPRTDTTPVHSWLLPYTPLVPKELLNKLYEALRLKLSVTLQEWSALDSSALQVIQPWLGHFSKSQFDVLLQRSILPKLTALLKNELEITTATTKSNKAFVVMQALAPWLSFMLKLKATTSTTAEKNTSDADAINSSGLNYSQWIRSLLVHDFFPEWFQVLYEWLGGAAISSSNPSEADFEQVSEWYMEWKKQIPAEVLQQDSILQQCFNRGLDMMNQAMSEQSIQDMYRQITAWLQSPATVQGGTPSVSVAHVPSHPTGPLIGSKLAPLPPASSAIAASEEGDDGPFLALVLQFATLNSLEFAPALRKGTVHGKQIYEFGPLQVLVNKGVIYCKNDVTTPAPQASSLIPGWRPISLEELLEKAQTTIQMHNRKQQQAEAAQSASESKSNGAAAGTEDVD